MASELLPQTPQRSEAQAPARRKDPRRWLRRCAYVAWLGWLIGAGIIWWHYRHWTSHPHFLPLTLAMAVQVLAGAWCVLLGLFGLALWPGRLRTCAWASCRWGCGQFT